MTSDRTESAVLVPLYRDAAGRVHIVFIRRCSGGVHGDQIAFPGGKHDPDDASFLDTALREAEEEIGLARSSVHVLAELPTMDTMTTRFRVHPFLARIECPEGWQPDLREVADVIEWPVEALADPANQGSSMERFPAWPDPVRIDYYWVAGHRLWGATYRMLSPLVPRILAGEWPI